MKNNTVLLYCFLISFVSTLTAGIVTTTVLVVEENEEPIMGADVKISYPPQFRSSQPYITGKGVSGADGTYSFKGDAHSIVFITVEKQYYYPSKTYVKVFHSEDGKKVFVDKEITVSLKKKINPIRMYADSRFQIKVSEFDRELGFDFMENDWIKPYGSGRNADIYFEITGSSQDYDNYDFTMNVRFPNEGDGLVSFESDREHGSLFKSPYEAPLEGYIGKADWRRFRKKTGNYSYETEYTNNKNINYMFRIRTVLDEEGNIKEAYYGKIYGDFGFGGILNPPEAFIKADAYYLNPNKNDRNLEAKVGQSMISGLKKREFPKLP